MVTHQLPARQRFLMFGGERSCMQQNNAPKAVVFSPVNSNIAKKCTQRLFRYAFSNDQWIPCVGFCTVFPEAESVVTFITAHWIPCVELCTMFSEIESVFTEMT